MNSVVIVGRVGQDPEIKYFESGKVKTTFSVAVSRWDYKTKSEATDWFNIELWDKQAEVAGNSLQKGHRVLVEGRLQIRSYDDNNGNKRYVTEVIGNSFEFIERKGDNGSSATATEPNFGDAFGSPVPFEEEIPF